MGTVCHNVTGICPQGCEDNWNGTMCDGNNKTHFISYIINLGIRNTSEIAVHMLLLNVGLV